MLLGAQLSEMAARDRSSTVVGIPAVLTVVWMHWGHISNAIVLAWTSFMLTVMGIRLLLGSRWVAAEKTPAQWHQLLYWRILISAIYGIGWGGSMIVLNTSSLDVLTAFKVGTLTAALGVMLNSMSVVFVVYLAFLIPCWISLMVYIFFLSGFLSTQDAIICGVAVTIFGVVLVGASFSIARLTRMFFLRKFELDEALIQTRASHQREMEMSEKLAEQARRDALTGAYNRRHLTEQLDYQINLYLRTQQPFSVISIDIDHFKLINDQHGHDVGDVVLKDTSNVMSLTLRDIDIFGRWGGEEFLCILPNTETEDAKICAERLRTSLKAARFDGSPEHLKVTASFGVTSVQNGDSVKNMIKRADLALYQAKANGRDQVCNFETIPLELTEYGEKFDEK